MELYQASQRGPLHSEIFLQEWSMNEEVETA